MPLAVGRDLPLRARAADDLAARPAADHHGQGRDRRLRRSRRPSWRRSSTRLTAFAKTLPAGYTVEVGGAVEESAKAQGPIAAVVPLMLLVMATILMIQLQSFHRLFLVVAVAPLGADRRGRGACCRAARRSASSRSWACSRSIGILIRNSVILIVQIEESAAARGVTPWKAVVEATEHRMRPIMLTAAAATLALIPICARDLLGADGLRDDGRHRRRHGADASVPAGALRRLVPDQGTRLTGKRSVACRSGATDGTSAAGGGVSNGTHSAALRNHVRQIWRPS